ncbi:hypothetical protein B0T20DRAFT_269535 [Sordaria brevicollis]|uniref:Uncharacterized protein n=1 Tax=Sordaria brevicollis TaxID=83679 RepID=A0AAE0PAQ7_SORBR|nr:hypothetical protein B0T20DRAFT_269535 [Sordaria brevicollis]
MARSSPLSPDGQLPIVLVPYSEGTEDEEGTATESDDTEHNKSYRDRKQLDHQRDERRQQHQQQPQPQPQPARPPPAPRHPIPSMQEAFAESLFEATQGGATPKPKLRTGDAKTRREQLLEQDKSAEAPAAQWRYRPGQQTHELRRLMSQISFGVYLLLNGMANSQMSVVTILQGHIDEVDEFLETILEDIGLATKDLSERIIHLRLPMDNIEVFERMLEDRNFRLRIIEGNEKIEHIVARTQVALQQIMNDIAEGLESTRDFTIYLAEQQHGRWRKERPDVIDIFDAMKGNTDGWFQAFMDLEEKGNKLNGVIVQLIGIISEMERRAGEVSRKTRFNIEPFTSPRHSPHASDASSVTTPPTSPIAKTPNTPPRLSLRLSSIVEGKQASPTSYFDLKITRTSTHSTSMDNPSTTPPQEISEEKLTVEEDSGNRSSAEFDLPIQSPPPPARNPRRLSKPAPPPLAPSQPEVTTERKEDIEEEEEEEKQEKEEEPVYLLQPKTYTPQTTPLPSPRVLDHPKPKGEPVSRKPESPVPTIEEPKEWTLEPKVYSKETTLEPKVYKKEVKLEAKAYIQEPTLEAKVYSQEPTLEAKVYSQEPTLQATVYNPPKPQLKPQPSKPKLAPVDTRDSRPASKQSNRMISESPKLRPQPSKELRSQQSKPRLAHVDTRDTRPTSNQSHRLTPDSLPEVVVHPEQRTSFRKRASQRTTPPDSIHIPRPDSPEYRDSLFPSSRTYQASDSAYGSDMERPPVNSIASFDTVADFPPPPPLMHPGFVSSPHSESGMQFWRPVQASPHSPLQQRPHTSGTQYSAQGQQQSSPYQSPYQSPQQPLGGQLHQVPPRNLPSAMGMSVRSNMTTGTTASQETNGKSLKKKRSAFGWLKKAFALDEEERAAFEARRQMETRNLYYDGRSAQFLDGKRIQAPLPRVPGQQYPPTAGPYLNGPYQSQQFQQSSGQFSSNQF